MYLEVRGDKIEMSTNVDNSNIVYQINGELFKLARCVEVARFRVNVFAHDQIPARIVVLLAPQYRVIRLEHQKTDSAQLVVVGHTSD